MFFLQGEVQGVVQVSKAVIMCVFVKQPVVRNCTAVVCS